MDDVSGEVALFFEPPVRSVFFGHEPSSFERRLVVVGSLGGPFGKFDLLPRRLLIWNHAQQVRDAVSRARFLSSERTMCQGACRCRSPPASVAGARVVVPAAAGRQVHRAELPLAQRVLDARLETPLLFLLADLQPELDQDDPARRDVALEDRAQFEETRGTAPWCKTPSHTRRRRGCTSCDRK